MKDFKGLHARSVHLKESWMTLPLKPVYIPGCGQTMWNAPLSEIGVGLCDCTFTKKWYTECSFIYFFEIIYLRTINTFQIIGVSSMRLSMKSKIFPMNFYSFEVQLDCIDFYNKDLNIFYILKNFSILKEFVFTTWIIQNSS